MRRRELLSFFVGLSTTVVNGAAYTGEAPKRVALVAGSTRVTQMHDGSTNVYFRTFFEELRRLPTLAPIRLYVTAGALMSYAPIPSI
jgi:hypothetical protein